MIFEHRIKFCIRGWCWNLSTGRLNTRRNAPALRLRVPLRNGLPKVLHRGAPRLLGGRLSEAAELLRSEIDGVHIPRNAADEAGDLRPAGGVQREVREFLHAGGLTWGFFSGGFLFSCSFVMVGGWGGFSFGRVLKTSSEI